MAKPPSKSIPDSLIDVLSEQVAREEEMLERIREAFVRKDTALVMQLLGQFFSTTNAGAGS